MYLFDSLDLDVTLKVIFAQSYGFLCWSGRLLPLSSSRRISLGQIFVGQRAKSILPLPELCDRLIQPNRCAPEQLPGQASGNYSRWGRNESC